MTVSELHKAHFRELQTVRLILRLIRMEDAEAMFEYTSATESFCFLRREPHQSVEEDRVFIQDVLEGYRQHREFVWGISLREMERLIGTCRIFDILPDRGFCEVSYLIHPAYRCCGIASEAIGRLIQYSFEELDCAKVFARCSAENIGSERVMQKCGMKKRSFLPRYMELHGAWHDFLLYEIERKQGAHA